MASPETPTKRFLEEDLEQLKKLGDLYTQSKLLILYSEEVDPSARSNIQVIKELRDANDHLMRVVAARLCDVPPNGSNEPGYCSKNLEKAIGHVYRAAFDALDGTVLSLREKIAQVLSSYPSAVVKEIIPDYWELRTKLDCLTQKIATHRAAKDVAGNVGDTLNLYVSDTEEIKGFYKRVIDSGPALDDCHAKHKEERHNESRHHLFTHVLGGLGYSFIGTVFGLMLVAFGCNPKDLLVKTKTAQELPLESQESSVIQEVKSPIPSDKVERKLSQ
jgi:hypothetical protein